MKNVFSCFSSEMIFKHSPKQNSLKNMHGLNTFKAGEKTVTKSNPLQLHEVF